MTTLIRNSARVCYISTSDTHISSALALLEGQGGTDKPTRILTPQGKSVYAFEISESYSNIADFIEMVTYRRVFSVPHFGCLPATGECIEYREMTSYDPHSSFYSDTWEEELWQDSEEQQAYEDIDVYYAAYGSNLNTQRFMRYMNKAVREGEVVTPDTLTSFQSMIPHKRYFAYRSGLWDGGGVAFIDTKATQAQTLVRLWKLPYRLFVSLAYQENGLVPLLSDMAFFPWEASLQKRVNNFHYGIYGTILNLGTIDTFPVLTCTGKARRRMPSRRYVDVINAGVAETKSLPFRKIEPFA